MITALHRAGLLTEKFRNGPIADAAVTSSLGTNYIKQKSTWEANWVANAAGFPCILSLGMGREKSPWPSFFGISMRGNNASAERFVRAATVWATFFLKMSFTEVAILEVRWRMLVRLLGPCKITHSCVVNSIYFIVFINCFMHLLLLETSFQCHLLSFILLLVVFYFTLLILLMPQYWLFKR